MPFDIEFSSNWTCSLESVATAKSCFHMHCYNGNCVRATSREGNTYGLCDCWPGWIGQQCNFCCDIPCLNNGTCKMDSTTDLPFCSCPNKETMRYMGLMCEDRYNETDQVVYIHSSSNEWQVPVIVTSVLLCLIAACMFATLYGMYRRRHPWLVKILISIQARFIDDSDRTYDAYLSYQSTNDNDRKFVVFKLLPFLENEGFSVCIDQRDFIPGAAIANSIAEAITESKRTILLLSPSYVDGEWPEFEVQCALKESLQRNHRIIPIVYEPLDEVEKELSATLRHVVDSIKCLKWPAAQNTTNEQKRKKLKSSLHESVMWIKSRIQRGRKDDDVDPVAAREDEFWKRLLLTLPKQKTDARKYRVQTDESEKGIRSLQSQTSLQSNASESNELIRVERAKKSNLFNRHHFDNIHSKSKVVQVVRPQPRRTSDTPKTENTEEILGAGMNKPETSDVKPAVNLPNTDSASGESSEIRNTLSTENNETVALGSLGDVSTSPTTDNRGVKLNIGFEEHHSEMAC